MNTRRRLLLAALIVIFLLVDAAALYWLLTSRGNYLIWDIHPTLVAANAVIEGKDPYSDEVTAEIQRQVYGRPAAPNEDVHAFAYPIYVAYLAIPLALLPLPWAQAAWLALLQLAILAGFLLAIDVWKWPRQRLARGGILLWCAVLYPVVWGFLLGQPALLAFAVIVLCVWAVARGSDRLAGVTLGLTWIKPQLAFLLFPGVLLWAIFRRRHKVWLWATGTFAAIVLLPMLLQPSWVSHFIHRLFEYDQYSPFTPPAVLLAQACCAPVAPWLGPLIVGLFLGATAWGWWRAIRSHRPADFLWAVGMTLIATTAVAPQTSTVNQVVLVLPIIGLVKHLFSKGRGGWAAAVLLLVFWGAALWLLSWLPPVATATPRYPVEHRVLSPILPVTLVILWLATHKLLTAESTGARPAEADRPEWAGGAK
ncbi:MAG: glycosyltransferase family 87 protein [Anaerolineales bacterium]